MNRMRVSDYRALLTENPGESRLRQLHALAVRKGMLSSSQFLLLRDLTDIADAEKLKEDDVLSLHALLICMLSALSEGNLCLQLEGTPDGATADPGLLFSRLQELLSAEETPGLETTLPAPPKLHRDIAALVTRGCCGLVEENGNFRPLVCVRSEKGSFLYFQRYYAYESELKANLIARLKAKLELPGEKQSAECKKILQEVLVGSSVLPKGQFTPQQRQAVALAMVTNFLILSGGPGTGKTATVSSILRALRRLNSNARIMIGAPTGRAAFRVDESLRADFSRIPKDKAADADRDLAAAPPEPKTLHRLLRYREQTNDFAYNRANPLPADIVIVDEVSMVDVCMMARLFDAVRPDAKLILVGDKDQLPSVDAGAVLCDLVPRDCSANFSAGVFAWLKKTLGDGGVAPSPLTPLPRGGEGDRGAPENPGTGSLLTDHVILLDFAKSMRLPAEVRQLATTVNTGQSAAVLKALASKEFETVSDPKTRNLSAAWPGKERPLSWLNLEDLKTWKWLSLLANWAEHQYARGYLELVQSIQQQFDFTQPRGGLQPEEIKKLSDAAMSAQILCLVRAGPYGSDGINRHLAKTLSEKFGKPQYGGFFGGEPILVTKNDPVNEVYNGDVGIVLQDSKRRQRVVFYRPKAEGQQVVPDFRMLPLDALVGLQPAFALTVHKSQGSEYGRVLLVLPPEHRTAGIPPASLAPDDTDEPRAPAADDLSASRLLTREIFYTGLTRTKESVVICATKAVLAKTIESSIRRQSGIEVQ
ncbi:MAG TPA: exodeoxyribonuclease V subunit alpha [Planctomycetota bacterium]|jgi:exodeoxyribonuclease V alpha subunit